MASSGEVGTHTGHCSARQTGVRAFREHTQGAERCFAPDRLGKADAGWALAEPRVRPAVQGRHVGRREHSASRAESADRTEREGCGKVAGPHCEC